MANRVSDVVVTGADEVITKLNHIITKDAGMERRLRTIIRKALQIARTATSKDIHAQLQDDPRQAYRAVLHSVYKSVFGGSVKILSKKRRGAPTTYQKPRTLDRSKPGGNRLHASFETTRRESYAGSDRGFVLRFLNAGTDERETRYGKRGSIAPRNLFARVAPWHMDTAVTQVATEIEEMVYQEMNR